MGGDPAYRTGSNLALVPAPKPVQTQLNIACCAFPTETAVSFGIFSITEYSRQPLPVY